MSPEITWLGVIMALVITGAIIFAYKLGKTAGRADRDKELHPTATEDDYEAWLDYEMEDWE